MIALTARLKSMFDAAAAAKETAELLLAEPNITDTAAEGLNLISARCSEIMAAAHAIHSELDGCGIEIYQPNLPELPDGASTSVTEER